MDQLTIIFEWVGATLATVLLAANGFFIARLVKKIDDGALKIVELSTKVTELSHEMSDQKRQLERLCELQTDVAILNHEVFGRRKGPGGENG